MTNFLIHCTKTLRRVAVFHTYSDLKFWYFIYLNYGCCLYNVDKLNIFLFYFLRLQHAVVVFLVTFFLFRLYKLSYSPDMVFNISLQFFLLWFFFILRSEVGFLSCCLLYYLRLRCVILKLN